MWIIDNNKAINLANIVEAIYDDDGTLQLYYATYTRVIDGDRARRLWAEIQERGLDIFLLPSAGAPETGGYPERAEEMDHG